MTTLTWRKSSYSSTNSTCVELAAHDGDVLVRNSTRPDTGTLTLSADDTAALVDAVKAGRLDDLT